MNRRLLALFAAAAAVAVVLTGCSSSGGTKPTKPTAAASGLNDQTQSGAYQGVGVDPPRPRPSFTLTDTAGKPFAFGQQTAGRPTLVYFGYTNCPDICPETMADISQALKALPVAVQKKTFVVFVSTDVKHDTSAVIARWLLNFSEGNQATWVGLRGTQAQVNAAQAASHIFLAEDGGETHSAQVLLFGPDDYARDSFVSASGEQDQIKHDLPLVAAG